MREYGGRPHWGKTFFLSADELCAVCPGHARFDAIRRTLDPRGTLVNPFAARVFGLADGRVRPIMLTPGALRNRYWALRHGTSLANEEGVVVSRPERGCAGYGLSAAGAREVREKLVPASLGAAGIDAARALVLTSDFARARETAEVLRARGGLPAPRPDERLRERDFGELEGEPNTVYDRIWARDRADPEHRDDGCESVAAVRARLVDLIAEIERENEGRDVVLVSHGDPLQILETWFRAMPAGEHRALAHLAPAELRRLG